MIKYTLTIVVVLLGLTWPSFIWSEDQPLEVQLLLPGLTARRPDAIVSPGALE